MGTAQIAVPSFSFSLDKHREILYNKGRNFLKESEPRFMKHTKILILYATKHGVTKRCAEMLAERLTATHTVTVSDVHKNPPAPTDYDIVVLGSSIRMGRMDKNMKNYIQTYADELSSMPSAVYLCCGFPRRFEEYIDLQLPRKLICSLGYHSFGGELKPEKIKGLDKLIVKAARNSIQMQDFEESDADHHDLPEILPENINLLANKIQMFSME